MSTPFPDQVAGNVRAALARSQVTQRTLAERTGRSQAYWSRRLNGETDLDVGDLEAVAGLVGVSTASLLAVPA